MGEYQIHTLANGLRIVHMQIPSNVSYCGFIVNAGTRDENTDEYGMAHFVEHMLFKGTNKRRSHHIISRMEVVGGELNAYTNKEETVIYSVFLEQHFERAFELLSDLTFNSQFPQHEIEKEVDVILDEINSYEDSPSELIFDEFENYVFKGSQLGHNILGEPDLLKGFDTAKSKLFVERTYIPSNIVFFSVGKTDLKKVIRLANKYLSDLFIQNSLAERVFPTNNERLVVKDNKNTSQSHVMIGGRSYGMHDPKRRALLLLNNMLGGPGMNSRLNVSLREKRGYVYNVESSLTNYSDTGLFSVYFGTDKQNVEKCIRLIHAELKKLRETKLTGMQLAFAKKQLIGQIAVSSDNHENLALSLGKSIMRYGHCDSIEEVTRKIEAISSENILDVANEILVDENLSLLIYI